MRCKMKEQGFTLVELLGVLIILAVIFMIITPTVSNIITESKETIYKKQINTILTAAYDFSLKNISYLPDEDKNINTTYVTVGELKYEGLIDVNITNPNTNEAFPDNLVISIEKKSEENNIEDPYMIEGNYLYTLKLSKLNDTSAAPKILLKNNEKEIAINNGIYILPLNLNDEVELSATAENEELNSKIKQYILLNNKIVDSIDTSKFGIYKINYSLVDNTGNANALTLSVVIGDTVVPTIIFPEENSISIEGIDEGKLEEFIKKDVICTDNSGFCDIEYPSVSVDELTSTGTTIEYKAIDPSGNSITQERTIKIG
ncbi:MAG: type II secretion system protein [Firmicutes bacterium]|nr:type II secretion system protein [Bacillota bacterium]